MTINVAVKCPDGIVMGADGLVTIPGLEKGEIASSVPYFTKLFEISGHSAAAMINGTGSIGGRTIEDVISEFNEKTQKRDTKDYSLEQVSRKLGNMIHNTIREYKKPVSLNVIIGGYSKGKKGRGKRYGEIYSLRWKLGKSKISSTKSFLSDYKYDIRPLYDTDRKFGTHYGGQPKIPDRFKYGTDDYQLEAMWKRRGLLFKPTEKYIIGKLRTKLRKELTKKGIEILANFSTELPKKLREFDIYRLLSNYELLGSGGEIINKVKENMIWKLETMEGYFSLQTAVNYCSFLMWCAYAENAFTLVIPTVGSEMRIATITREHGFELIRKWDIQSPGPPFK